MSGQFLLTLPAAASSLHFASSNSLYVGAVDGSVRLYNLPSQRVVQAIRSLGDEVSSIVSTRNKDGDLSDIWVASGRLAFSFATGIQRLVLSSQDAKYALELGEDDEDVLNELNLSSNSKTLAFSTDAGSVGIVELPSRRISRMRTRHTNICGSVKFIPDRPNELLSGGYDSALLHFDFTQGSVLSRYDIAAPPPASGVSLSPPFVQSISISSAGLLAASTADGRVWLGGGGEKRPGNAKKKRSRKWEGLKEDEGLWLQVAEGPVVAVAFSNHDHLVTCTLLGRVALHTISRNEEDKLQADIKWQTETKAIAKVNAMCVNDKWIVIGGLDRSAKGAAEIWDPNSLSQQAVS